MRLKQRMNVLLPQPDGPMKAVTWFLKISSDTPRRAGMPEYVTVRSLTSNSVSWRPDSASRARSANSFSSTPGIFAGAALALSISSITIFSGSGCGARLRTRSS